MDRQDDVAAVVLAAGESRRFGSPKQLARLEGRTLLEHVLDTARLADLRPVVAVVPVWLTRPAALDDPALIWVRNPHPERGMSHSLKLGFAALPRTVVAAVILLGDQPGVPPEHLRALLAARGTVPFVATVTDGIPQPPLLVEREQFAAVTELGGDAGLRDLLRGGSHAVAAVPSQTIADIDTPADLQ
ncbi:MAG TPA: nucleotidyltransferase family protein [Candidatus Limnocylindria bacterium]|nr:nucleotidyltransferase family protein [Candidatus Limnocylindria bacterium]